MGTVFTLRDSAGGVFQPQGNGQRVLLHLSKRSES